MSKPNCESLMGRAVELSKHGFPAPNPRVGCVIELDGEIVGEGYHDHAGGPHAEVMALKEAGEKARGSTVYVTLEPCNHHGRTGPCTEALIAAGVKRLVYAVSDPNPAASGGAARLRAAGVDVAEGHPMSTEAMLANHKWLNAVRLQRPYVIGKVAISLDGRPALPNGLSKWITGPEARYQGHVLRAECGAVLVGRGTVERDNPALTVRDIDVVNQPLRIVIDRYRTLPMNRKIFDRKAPYLRVVASSPGPHEVEATIEDNQIQLEDLLSKLYKLGVTGLLVEGGATTMSRFLEAKLINRLEMFIAPRILGSGQPWATFGAITDLAGAQQWSYSSIRSIEDDLWITAYPVG